MSVLLLLLPFSLPAHHVVETLECFLALFIPPQVPTMTDMYLLLALFSWCCFCCSFATLFCIVLYCLYVLRGPINMIFVERTRVNNGPQRASRVPELLRVVGVC